MKIFILYYAMICLYTIIARPYVRNQCKTSGKLSERVEFYVHNIRFSFTFLLFRRLSCPDGGDDKSRY